MKIELIKIKRYWWLPIICKEAILRVTQGNGLIIDQPIRKGWKIEVDANGITAVNTNKK